MHTGFSHDFIFCRDCHKHVHIVQPSRVDVLFLSSVLIMQRSTSTGSAMNRSPKLPSSGTTASASFQSHLSTVNSAHRLRSHPGPLYDLEKQEDGYGEADIDSFPPPISSLHRSKVVKIKSRIKWTLALYACFSVIFLPVSVVQTFGYLSCGLICAVKASQKSWYS